MIPRLQRHMLALSPGARHLSIDTGHVPQLAQPDLLARLIAEGLATNGIRVGEQFERSQETMIPDTRQ